MLEKFETQIEKIRTDSTEIERNLRSRYDLVISGLNEERTQLRSNLAAQMKGLSKRGSQPE